MRFTVLGPVRFGQDDQLVELRAPMRRRLLGVLLCRVGEALPMRTLVDAMWPDDPPDQAEKAVHLNAMRLRRDLGDPERIVSRAGGYALVVQAGELDAARFDELIARASDARSAGESERAIALLDEALALWSGSPYAHLEDCDLVRAEAERLTQTKIQALEERTAIGLEAGRHVEMVPELTRLVSEHPYRENLAGLLMLALYRSGRQADALDVFARTRDRLADELGVDPGGALRELHGRILRREPGLDLPVPEVESVVPAQLPADLTSFVGREHEIEELERLVAAVPDRAASSVVVLQGMGGVGKTSLSVRVAHRLAAEFVDGQIFLDLHGFTPGADAVEPVVALERLLGALGVPADRIPRDPEDRAALWRTRLAGKRVLLVFDNVASAEQLRPLLPGAPGCFVLATSRRAMPALDDAYVISLDTLSGPEAVSLVRQVIGERRLAEEPPELVDEMIELCGGLPLALRVAAARWRARPARSLADLVTRLADAQGRLAELEVSGRSVETALRLSYEDLTPDQRRLYRLLGTHPGHDFDAYVAAALSDIDERQAGRLLDNLADAHLVLVEGDRYRFHDLVRTYAASLVTEAERDTALDRLGEYYCSLASAAMDLVAPATRSTRPAPPVATRAIPRLRDRAGALARLDAELGNFVAVAGACADHDRPGITCHVAFTLARYVNSRWLNHDSLVLHGHAVRAAEADGAPEVVGTALNNLARTYLQVERHQDAERCIQQAIARLEGTEYTERLANGYETLARTSIAQGRFRTGVAHAERELVLYRDAGSPAGQIIALCTLAAVHGLLKDRQSALSRVQEALRLSTAVDDEPTRADMFRHAANAYADVGDRQTAIDYAERAVASYRTLRNQVLVGLALSVLGNACAGVDDERAIGHHTEALTLATELDHDGVRGEAALNLAETLLGCGRATEALPHARTALRCAAETGWPRDVARAHRCLARCYDEMADPDRAADHWAEAFRIFQRLDVPDAEEIRSRVREPVR